MPVIPTSIKVSTFKGGIVNCLLLRYVLTLSVILYTPFYTPQSPQKNPISFHAAWFSVSWPLLGRLHLRLAELQPRFTASHLQCVAIKWSITSTAVRHTGVKASRTLPPLFFYFLSLKVVIGWKATIIVLFLGPTGAKNCHRPLDPDLIGCFSIWAE